LKCVHREHSFSITSIVSRYVNWY
jgi:hypothetical protein